MGEARPFQSWFLGGFECSSHRRLDGRQLDLVAATRHDHHAEADYAQLGELGIRTVRDGVRWHLVESTPGRYDWGSVLPMARAAESTRTQVIWDLCHYGWPAHLDIWSEDFPRRFGDFAVAVARVLRDELSGPPVYTPVNEISYWAWAAGDNALFQPLGRGRGRELKRQLVRAYLEAVRGIRSVDTRARFLVAEPVIHVVADIGRPQDRELAEAMRQTMYEAWDMIAGRAAPELGGTPFDLDLVGVNYYWNNQWAYQGGPLGLGHELYRPLHTMLVEVWERYQRPLVISETGAEGANGAAWLRYVTGEAREAIAAGAPVEGLCIYPVLDYPGWENERHCVCGLLGAGGPGDWASRRIHEATTAELLREQAAIARFFEERPARRAWGPEEDG